MTIEEYEKIESTHKYLKENQQQYKEKTVIIAERQTGGIGTKGRSWFTGSNKNIATSLKKETGKEFDKQEIIQRFIKTLENII